MLNPDEYVAISYDSSKVQVTITSTGIFVKALADIPAGSAIEIVIQILANDGSSYSKTTISLTTDGVPSGGGGGGGGGGAIPPAPTPGARHEPYITGFEDGTFRPMNPVTRAEAVTMINRLLERDPATSNDLHTKTCPFTDITAAHWAYWQVMEASVTHEH